MDQSKKRTLGRINQLTLFLLTCLVRSPFIRARSAWKTKNTKEVLRAAKDKNRVAAMISLSRIPTSILKRKKRNFLRSNTSTTDGKIIILPSVPKKGSKKLVSILMTSTPVTAARKKAFGNTETIGNDKNDINEDEDLGTKLIGSTYLKK